MSSHKKKKHLVNNAQRRKVRSVALNNFDALRRDPKKIQTMELEKQTKGVELEVRTIGMILRDLSIRLCNANSSLSPSPFSIVHSYPHS